LPILYFITEFILFKMNSLSNDTFYTNANARDVIDHFKNETKKAKEEQDKIKIYYSKIISEL
jgi:hypothetical protein